MAYSISELIEILEEIKKKHGDLIVKYAYNDCGYVMEGEDSVSDVEVETRDGKAVFVRLS